MTDTLFGLVADYGVWVIAASCYLSCLLVPIPTSLLMLAGGAFVASGDLDGGTVLAGAWLGAVLGDQTGYAVGRRFGPLLTRLTDTNAARKKLYARATETVRHKGEIGVFFSTWLFAPLGPWVNMAAGASGLHWVRFTLWDAAGEAIWVFGYIVLGYSFAGQVTQISELTSSFSGFLVAALATGMLGWMLMRAVRKARARHGQT
ncbi:DedA family protein [Marivita sp. XM-24bin2]|uniref:DedA family protein n=1 Tax=unclassified Marivita TaxID=2632480 RepID=UPI0025BFF4E9|nr:DedA family protein [Marivita sp. XM-24bin2]MCR9110406.1 DedA family protein [Paracoccaceae bacterium]